MLAFFRRIINSKAGLIVTFAALAMIALAFAAGDVSGLRTRGLAALGGADDVMTVGGAHVSAAEFRARVAQEVDGLRQQQPGLTTAQFVAQGGLEQTAERLGNGLALEQFGARQGLVVSKRAVDGQIASIPGLQGPNGDFDPMLFRQLLAERHLTERDIRDDVARSLMVQMLTSELARPTPAPAQLARPYADASLEKRAGEIAFVSSAAMPAGPPPGEAELKAFYARQLARYVVPERRVIRYARIGADQVKAQATPTEAEIAAAYQRDRAKYQPSEHRDVTSVVVLDRAGAAKLAAAAKAGSLAAAAKAAGLAAAIDTGLDKAALAAKTSPALADAVFAAAKGATVGPVRGALGYTVAHVDGVTQVPGRTPAQAHDEIAAALTKAKTAAALAALHDRIDDSIGGHTTFDELAGDYKLASATTPPLLPDGVDPEAPAARPDPALAPLLAAAFRMQPGDAPQLVPAGPDGFAVVALGRVLPAAPRPFDQARARVAADVAADRAQAAARAAAQKILQAVNGGRTLAQAWAASGIAGAPPHPLAASRDDVDRAQGPTRAPLALLFAMPRGAVRLLAAPGAAGWAILRLDTITPGDAAKVPNLQVQYQNAFAQALGQEAAEELARAARMAVGVKTNAAALAQVRADLLGGRGGGE